MNVEDRRDQEFADRQFLVAHGQDDAAEGRDALIDARNAEWADIERRLEDPVWPTRVVVASPEEARAAYERAPVILVDTRTGEVTGVRPPAFPDLEG